MVTAEALPALAELPAHLADPSGRHLEGLAQVLGALVAGHRLDDAALPWREGLQPGREVETELDLVRDRGDGVVAQPLLEGIEVPLAIDDPAEVLVRPGR